MAKGTEKPLPSQTLIQLSAADRGQQPAGAFQLSILLDTKRFYWFK